MDLYSKAEAPPVEAPTGEGETLDDQVARVWEDWRERMNVWQGRAPDSRVLVFSTSRDRLIRRILSMKRPKAAGGGLAYTADDLLLLFRWAWESDDRAASWLRGEERGGREGGWLALDNLLVTKDGKLDTRLEMARAWAPDPDVQQPGVIGDPRHGTGVDLGWMGAFAPAPAPHLPREAIEPAPPRREPEPRRLPTKRRPPRVRLRGAALED